MNATNATTNAVAAKPPMDPELKQFLAKVKAMQRERDALVQPAAEALARLVVVCANRTGQSQHLRALLFSLWNGKPARLNETLGLDWELKRDFCAVLLAFGHDEFFYKAVQAAFEARGLFAWFTAEGDER